MMNMEKYTPTTTSSSADDSSNMNSAMVDKIADIFAQINAKKAEVRLILLVVYILYFKLDEIPPIDQKITLWHDQFQLANRVETLPF